MGSMGFNEALAGAALNQVWENCCLKSSRFHAGGGDEPGADEWRWGPQSHLKYLGTAS